VKKRVRTIVRNEVCTIFPNPKKILSLDFFAALFLSSKKVEQKKEITECPNFWVDPN
jgi:hypothetical protein